MVSRAILIFLVGALFPLMVEAQGVTVTGRVRDNKTGKGLAEVNIKIKGRSTGASSDSTGLFRLSISSVPATLIVSHVGYQVTEVRVSPGKASFIEVELRELDKLLDEVLVTSRPADYNYNSTEIGTAKLDMATIDKMPAFLGEQDILKTVLLLPGVTSVGEGTTGFNVRGGATDQNLILMDRAPLFNTSHLMGLLSDFNGDVVDNVTLYKGGIPSNFGGRVSSILDTKLKAANAEKWAFAGGIGLLANRLLIEGPLVSNKLSFYLAARLSYPDYLFKLSKNPQVRNTSANFYDLNGKIQFRVNNKNRLDLTVYSSNDNFKLSGDSLSSVEINASSTLFNWRSNNASLTWKRQINAQSDVTTGVLQSLYFSNMSTPDSLTAYNLKSSIKYYNAFVEFTHNPNARNDIRVGLTSSLYNVQPGTLSPASDASNINQVILPAQKGIESAVYFRHEWTYKRLSILYGLRCSLFSSLGEQTVYSYQVNSPRTEETIIDSTYYGNRDVAESYHGFEPRLSARLRLTPSSSIKLGYNRMFQYLQQISNTTAALPTDRWQLSSTYIKPSISDQVSAGYFLNFRQNMFETSFELFYKEIHNATDYKDGTNLLLTPVPETGMLQGIGKAYGIELLLRKQTGKLTGWTSYTYSNAVMKINGEFPEEKINGGDWYETNYNRPHTVNLVISYRTTPRVMYSANFTYGSGRPATYPEDKYLVDGTLIPNFIGRNNQKIPDYHRLDLSLTVDEKKNTDKRWKSSWVFSIYNVYGRKNAYSIFFKTKNDNHAVYYKKANGYKLSVYGTVFPSITYNFRF